MFLADPPPPSLPNSAPTSLEGQEKSTPLGILHEQSSQGCGLTKPFEVYHRNICQIWQMTDFMLRTILDMYFHFISSEMHNKLYKYVQFELYNTLPSSDYIPDSCSDYISVRSDVGRATNEPDNQYMWEMSCRHECMYSCIDRSILYMVEHANSI